MLRISASFIEESGERQRWSRGYKARGQGQGHKKNPRPRSRTAFPRTDPLEAKNRNARGQGQGPRTQAQVLSKKKKGLHKNFSGDFQKKRSFTKIFHAISTKNVFQNIFQTLHKILTIQTTVLSSSRGQVNFRGLEASRPRPRTSKCVLEDVFEDSTSGKRSSFLWQLISCSLIGLLIIANHNFQRFFDRNLF